MHWLRTTTVMSAPAASPTPVETEVIAYDRYLEHTCGAAVQIRLQRTRHVQAFLTALFGARPVRHEIIGPAALTAFVTRARSRSGRARPA